MCKRVLIVRTDRVGDVVMITPMIREIRKAFPDAFIATLTQPNTAQLLLNNPHLDAIITDDLKKETFWDVVKQLKEYRFTDGILVLPTKRAAWQMFWARIKNRIGTGRKIYEALTLMKSVSRNNYIPLKHEADFCMDLARKMGVTTENIQPEIFVTKEEKDWASDFIKNLGISENTYRIVLHTGSLNSAPNWSEDRYFELIQGIINKYPVKDFVLLLTAFEMTVGFKKRIKNLNDKRIFDISCKINNLRELIKIISSADLMLCSSTGPIHLADALDIKCIGIHCHRAMNSVKFWGVLNKKSINLEVTKEYCDMNCSSDKNICNFEHGIHPNRVLEHVIL